MIHQWPALATKVRRRAPLAAAMSAMRANGLIDMPSGGSQAVANCQRWSLEGFAMIESSRIHRPSHARRLLAVLTLLLGSAAEGAEASPADLHRAVEGFRLELEALRWVAGEPKLAVVMHVKEIGFTGRYRKWLGSSWQIMLHVYLYVLALLNCHDCAVSSSKVVATCKLERSNRLRSSVTEVNNNNV